MSATLLFDVVGWVATAVFVGSYFCRRPAMLRSLQMAGAAIWVLYGIALGAIPVVAANVLVLAAAAFTAVRARRAGTSGKRPIVMSDSSPTGSSVPDQKRVKLTY